jgi:hypothetical protein
MDWGDITLVVVPLAPRRCSLRSGRGCGSAMIFLVTLVDRGGVQVARTPTATNAVQLLVWLEKVRIQVRIVASCDHVLDVYTLDDSFVVQVKSSDLSVSSQTVYTALGRSQRSERGVRRKCTILEKNRPIGKIKSLDSTTTTHPAHVRGSTSMNCPTVQTSFADGDPFGPSAAMVIVTPPPTSSQHPLAMSLGATVMLLQVQSADFCR